MRSRRFWLVVAGLAGASALTAQEPPPSPNPDMSRPLRQRIHQPEGAPGLMMFGMYAPERLVDRRDVLELTPEQVARLESLAQEARTAREQADTTARIHEQQLRSLWETDAPDVRAIETQLQAAHAARLGGQLAAARAAARAKAILTPEQRGRVAGWRDSARLTARRGMSPRPDRPGGPAGRGRLERRGMGLRRG